jgi:c-di-GMP-binding flagellar brake protein YcgR
MNTLIKRQLPEALVVEVPESGTLEKGTELLLYYFDDSGVYRVTTRIIEISHAALYLAHAEQLQRLQRREFDRAEVRLPAVIRDTDEDEGRYVRGTLLDVGGGGAKVSSSGRTFANGTHVDLALNPDNARSLRVTGVVRHNRDHVHHIQFDSLSQHAQDRLYQIVFERERSRARER